MPEIPPLPIFPYRNGLPFSGASCDEIPLRGMERPEHPVLESSQARSRFAASA